MEELKFAIVTCSDTRTIEEDARRQRLEDQKRLEAIKQEFRQNCSTP